MTSIIVVKIITINWLIKSLELNNLCIFYQQMYIDGRIKLYSGGIYLNERKGKTISFIS